MLRRGAFPLLLGAFCAALNEGFRCPLYLNQKSAILVPNKWMTISFLSPVCARPLFLFCVLSPSGEQTEIMAFPEDGVTTPPSPTPTAEPSPATTEPVTPTPSGDLQPVGLLPLVVALGTNLEKSYIKVHSLGVVDCWASLERAASVVETRSSMCSFFLWT